MNLTILYFSHSCLFYSCYLSLFMARRVMQLLERNFFVYKQCGWRNNTTIPAVIFKLLIPNRSDFVASFSLFVILVCFHPLFCFGYSFFFLFFFVVVVHLFSNLPTKQILLKCKNAKSLAIIEDFCKFCFRCE